MMQFKKLLNSIVDWLFVGKRLPIVIVLLIVVTTGIALTIATTLNKKEPETVTAFVTVEGLGEEKDFENRQIKIRDGDSIKEIFSLKNYPNLYEEFGKPLIQYNEFYYFLGVRKTSEKSFYVTIDGLHENNLDQAYVYGGQTIVIKYY